MTKSKSNMYVISLIVYSVLKKVSKFFVSKILVKRSRNTSREFSLKATSMINPQKLYAASNDVMLCEKNFA